MTNARIVAGSRRSQRCSNTTTPRHTGSARGATRQRRSGPRLAARIHDELRIETLEELEAAATGGTLARIAGFGPRRVAAVRDVLATRLVRSHRPVEPLDRPPVELLLAIATERASAA